MNKGAYTYRTICSNKKSGEILLDADLQAANMVEAETRAYVTCIRAGNNYDEVMIMTKKIEVGPTLH